MKLTHNLAFQKIPTHIHNSDQWIDVLKYLTQFQIQELWEIAIWQLTNQLSPSKKIMLAIKCNIGPWLTTGYTTFATRQQCISAEDKKELGPSRTSNLFCVWHRRLEVKLLHDV
jgi:hypothetical protein